MKKLVISILIFLACTFLFPVNTFALSSEDSSAYTDNVLVGPKEGLNTVIHFFRIDVQFFPGLGPKDNQHSVQYEKESSNDTCWKMTKADYFSITSSFYACYVSGTKTTETGTSGSFVNSTFLIYKKINPSGKAIIDNMKKVDESDYSSSPSEYMKNYIKVMQADPTFEMTKKEEALKYYFPGRYNGTLYDKGGSKPVVEIPAANHSAGLAIDRPSLKFELEDVDGWRGTFASDQNNFYFKPIDINGLSDKYLVWLLTDQITIEGGYKIIEGVRVKISQSGTGSIIYKFDGSQWGDINTASLKFEQKDWWNTIVNRVYNARAFNEQGTLLDKCGRVTRYDGGKGVADPKYEEKTDSGIRYLSPMVRCLNTTEDGWLAQWLGKDWAYSIETTFSALTENYNTEIDYCPKAEIAKPATWFSSSLCGLGVALYQGGQKLMDFAQRQLLSVLGYTKPGNAGY